MRAAALRIGSCTFLASAGLLLLFATPVLAEDLPAPYVIGAPPVYAPTSIARPAGDVRHVPAWTSPPSPPAPPYEPGVLAPSLRDRVPAVGLSTAGVQAASLPPPRFVRRSAQPYDITTGPYRPHGPSEVRDEWLLAQPRMTLPAMSPDPLPTGQWRLNFYINRGNDFGFDQSGPAEMPTDRRFLIDGEHQTTAVDVRYGLSNAFSVGARLPIQWRGGGFMDGIIDWFHDLTADFGTLDNGRPSFRTDQFRMEGRDNAFNQLSWTDDGGDGLGSGTGLGRLELNAQWNVLRPCRRCDWRAAVVTRVGLPTGSGPFSVPGVDVGLQATVAKQIHPRWDLYGGVGGTWFSETELKGIIYEDLRAWGFLAVEWHVARTISLVVEFDAASRLVANLARYPALSSYVNISGRWDVSRCVEVELGFTENLEDQQGTIDFGGYAGLTLRL